MPATFARFARIRLSAVSDSLSVHFAPAHRRHSSSRICSAALLLPAILLTLSPDSFASDLSARETPLVRAVRECRGAIVNIHTEKSEAVPRQNRLLPQKERKVTGMGTGIVIDERGYIVTNYHVIQDVQQIIVTQEDGETYTAEVIDTDPRHDLAIIRIHPVKPLNIMAWGTSSDVMLAEQVFAVGNAFGYEHTVTAGIVSAVARNVEVDETLSYENLIQTDASINPGNSGGPLLNLDGEIIGINVAIRAGAQRIGFAIPIDDARRVVARLLSTRRRSGFVHGVEGRDMNTPGAQHLVVKSVVDNSPAAAGGIKPGDIIRRVGTVEIADQADLERALLGVTARTDVPVTVERGGAPVELTMEAGATERSVPLVNVAASTAPKAENSGTYRAWKMFGIRLANLSERERRRLPARYNGGMKVLFVRSGSPADRDGLRNGDVLVGLDGYETLGEPNLVFLLDSKRIESQSEMQFQIVRNGSRALMGTLRLVP